MNRPEPCDNCGKEVHHPFETVRFGIVYDQLLFERISPNASP